MDRAAPQGTELCCKRCGARLCATSARRAVDGAEEHELTNPSGHTYRVACFGSVPGARPVGVPTRYWTWFPGHRWRRCWCRGCDGHLGWLFESEADPFHALILARLTIPPEVSSE